MMKFLYAAVAALACSALASGAMAWVDDFDGYALGPLEVVAGGLYAPETNETVDDIWEWYGGGYVVGYGGTQGVIGQTEARVLGHAFRPNDGSNVLTGRGIIHYGDWSIAALAFTRTNTYSVNDAWWQGEWGGADSVTISLEDANGPVSCVLVAADYNDATNTWQGSEQLSVSGLNIGTWYDFELTISDTTATGRIRESDGPGSWTYIGAVTCPVTDGGDPFEANYVGLATRRAASLDDVEVSFGEGNDPWQERHDALMANGPGEYGIGLASSMTKILPKVFLAGEIKYVSTVSLQAARNEMEATQMIVYSPDKSLTGVVLGCSDLVGDAGAIIDNANIFAAPVGFVETQQPLEYAVSHVGWWPDPILTNLASFDIVQSDLQPVWYSVRVPVGTPPGMYHGTLTITPSNSAPTVIPVDLEVWGLTLPDEASLNTAVNDQVYSAYKHESPSPTRMNILNDAFDRYLVDHRCNPGDIYRSAPPDETRIARWAEIGVTSFNITYIKHQDVDPGYNPYKREKPEIRQLIADTLAIAQNYGIEDRAYVYMVDEASGESISLLADYASWLKSEFPDLTLVTSARLFSCMNDEAAAGVPFGTYCEVGSLDWLCITMDGWHNKHWPDYARDDGKQVWWYIASYYGAYPNVFIEYPAMDPRLMMGFMAYAYEPDGFLYWSMMREDNNDKKLTGGPYTDWNPNSWGQENGSGHLFYPGQNGPITSIRMENWLDGMEDYEYLLLAQQRVHYLLAAGKTDEANQLNDILEPYQNPGGWNDVVYGLTSQTQDPDVVEDARRALATGIINTLDERLQAAKIVSDGTVVYTSGMIATTDDSDFSGFFYIEDPDRTCGIRVVPASTIGVVSRGSIVEVSGTMATTGTGERYISNAAVNVTGTTSLLGPLAVTNGGLGGSDFGAPPNYQVGVPDGIGPNNVGLLVRVWGRATVSGMTTIDDGSGTPIMVVTSGLTNPPTDGSFATLTGISSIAPGGGRFLLAID